MVMASEHPNRRLLCILGMHRSGTSVTTSLLHRLGAQLSPELVAAIAGVNDDGFWEDSRVVQLNDELLQAAGLRWYDLAAPGEAGAAEALRQAAASHFADNYAGPGTWLVKDPRLCRLLPFWLETWRSAGLSPLLVHTLRHPHAVARSLQRRDRIPLEYGIVLWLLHTLEAMSHSGGQPGVLVVFEDLLREPLRLPQRLADGYGVEFPVERARWQELADSTVKALPRHFETGLDETFGLRELTDFAVSVYGRLRAFAYGEIDPALVASLSGELRILLERYDDELRMLRRCALDLMTLSAETVRIGEMHSHAITIVQERDETIARIIADRDQLIKDIAYFRFWRLVPRLIRRINRQ